MHVQSDQDYWNDSQDDFDSAVMMIDDDTPDVKPKTNGQVKHEPVEHDLSAKDVKAAALKKDENPSWLSVYDSLAIANEETLGALTSAISASVKASNINALEPDGSLRFFWIDYLELDGKVYFIGKLKDKTSGVWVSCSVTVENLQRNLFVLPREKRVEEDEEGDIYETDDLVKPEDVYADFDRVRKHVGIKSWRGKFVERQYAFGEADVPKEKTQWLKVVYGFNGRR
jgi:DNA polymerase alpha subunit A